MKMERIGIQKKQGSVVEILKHEILLGNIPSGTEMTQNELATSLGVSRMPVREALILLEYQGLVDRLPNNHVRVSQLSEEYFQKIFEMFLQMEQDAFLYVIKEKDELPEDELEWLGRKKKLAGNNDPKLQAQHYLDNLRNLIKR